MACLYIQEQSLSLLKKVTWAEYAVMKINSVKSKKPPESHGFPNVN